ncbi:hypothetical protein Dimus_035170 [Dionaea muscipula]
MILKECYPRQTNGGELAEDGEAGRRRWWRIWAEDGNVRQIWATASEIEDDGGRKWFAGDERGWASDLVVVDGLDRSGSGWWQMRMRTFLMLSSLNVDANT